MSQTTAETPLTPAEIARRHATAEVTVRQWITTGLLIPDGPGRKRRLKLKAVRAGGRWKVPPEELEKFLKATTDAYAPDDSPPSAPTESEVKRRKRAEDADRRAAELLG